MRRRVVIAVAALAVVGGGIIGLTQGGLSGPDEQVTAAGPTTGHVDQLALTPTSKTQASLPAHAIKDEFTTVGVTWDQATTQLDGTVQVRTKSVATGQWSDWRSLAQDDSGPVPARSGRAMRGGTSPMWVGLSDGVEVRVRTANGSVSLPSGLNVALVNPESGSTTLMGYDRPADAPSPGDTTTPTDTASPAPTDTSSAAPSPTDTSAGPSASPTDSGTASPAGSASPTATASPTASASPSASPSPTLPSQLPSIAAAYPNCPNTPSTHVLPNPLPKDTSSPIPAPPFITRAGWGANECIRVAGYPAYGSAVKVVFVHHTDDPNNYSCSDSAALVRAAYLYHVQVEGWDDIGYNFLVDKCGQIFEGRFGGASLPITGAQTYGFNTNSTGIAAIGTYTDLSGGDASASSNAGATPTDSMLRSIAWIAAWKLGMSGLDPVSGTSVLPEGGTEPVSEQKFQNGQQVTFKVISGHRDGWNTDCPGDQLYNDLATIRALAENPITTIDGGEVRYNNSEWVTRSAATVHWATATAQSSISGFDVLVDGVSKAHVDGSVSQAAITLSGSGSHQVAVQTDLTSGSTVKSAAATVVVDTTAPTFPTAPGVSIGGGSVTTTAIPVGVTWRAADNIALASVAATSPSTATFATTATAWGTTAKPGATNVYTLRATDIAGNAGTASVSRTASVLLSGSGARAGSWEKHLGSNFMGGYAWMSKSRGASITFTFTGRAVALVATRAPTSGQGYVYLDGVKVATINLYGPKTLYHQAVWSHGWSASGKHTVKIVVVGTAGHPTLPIEGVAILG